MTAEIECQAMKNVPTATSRAFKVPKMTPIASCEALTPDPVPPVTALGNSRCIHWKLRSVAGS